MYYSKNVKCAYCGDIFRIEYDSRRNNQSAYTCKCGKLKCHLNNRGDLFYSRGGICEKLSQDEEEYYRVQYEEDYINLPDSVRFLLTEIDMMGRQLDKKCVLNFSNYTDQDQIFLSLDNGTSLEKVKISVNIALQDDSGWRDQQKRLRQVERMTEAMTLFKNILIQIKTGKLDLSNPQKIWEDKTLEFDDGIRKQKELYDYELIC